GGFVLFANAAIQAAEQLLRCRTQTVYALNLIGDLASVRGMCGHWEPVGSLDRRHWLAALHLRVRATRHSARVSSLWVQVRRNSAWLSEYYAAGCGVVQSLAGACG